VLFRGDFAMKTMRWMLLLIVGLGLSAPATGRADTNHAHATQGDSIKSMKAFTKQQKKQQKQLRKAEKKAQKEAKKRAASQRQSLGQQGY
jgi:uncharacterized protein HemX